MIRRPRPWRRRGRLLEAVEHVAELRLGGPGELRLLDAVDVELVPARSPRLGTLSVTDSPL